jgi:colicin import membrane protein
MEKGDTVMVRYVRMTMLGVALASMATGAVWAQVPAPSPQIPAPGGADRPMPEARPAPQTTTGMVEGTVKKVDPMGGTLRVSSGPFGLFSKMLEVGPDTQVSVDGRDSNLAEIREGAKVKAAYETRNGRTIATRIETVPSGQATSHRSS